MKYSELIENQNKKGGIYEKQYTNQAIILFPLRFAVVLRHSLGDLFRGRWIRLQYYTRQKNNTTYHGITTNKGIESAGAEFHAGMSQTRTIYSTKFNIFDLAKRVYHKIVG